MQSQQSSLKVSSQGDVKNIISQSVFMALDMKVKKCLKKHTRYMVHVHVFLPPSAIVRDVGRIYALDQDTVEEENVHIT